MKIPYRDLKVNNPVLKESLLRAVEKVLDHGRIILGPEVEALESKIAGYCKKKYAVGVNSGTDALYLALRSLNIGPGDEVITTPLSWIATLNAIILCGASPVFVDIDEDLNIDARLIESSIGSNTKAIIPVHFTGKLCNMTEIMDIANANNLKVVEDASQAFGAQLKGTRAGGFGDVNCFSLNPMKVLCAYGEAGCAVTDDRDIFEKLTALRYAGTINREDCHYPSLNGRIDTIQAAMILVELENLDVKIRRLREIAKMYTENLKNIVGCPDEGDSFHVYYSYTIVTDRRDELKEYLLKEGIETKIQHPILMPNHTAYKHLKRPIIPVAERLVRQILCLPNHEKLTNENVNYIIKTVIKFFQA